MDLLHIARKLWRYKLVTVPIIAMMIAASAYVLVVKKPLYEASSSYLLINPPAPPTADEIAQNPELGKIRSDNPYTRFADQAVVIDVLTRSMNGEAAREALVDAGADPRYLVASGAQFGSSTPIIQITGTGSTPKAAMDTAEIVGHGVVGELDRMQAAQKVDSPYRIKTMQVEAPDGAQLRASGQLRMLVAVLALGVIFLFVIVSLFDAVATLVAQRRAPLSEPLWGPDDLALLDPDPKPETRINGHWDGSPSTTPFKHPA